MKWTINIVEDEDGKFIAQSTNSVDPYYLTCLIVTSISKGLVEVKSRKLIEVLDKDGEVDVRLSYSSNSSRG